MLLRNLAFIGVALLILQDHPLAAEAPKVVEVVTLRPATITQRAKLIGVVKAKKESHLTAQTVGVIDKIFAKEGMRVAAGTDLARLRNDEVREAYSLAHSNAKVAKLQYERVKKLFEEKDVSKKALEEAQTQWSASKIAVEGARSALNKTVFEAPFDGVCGVFRISEGAYVQPGEEIVAFYDPSGLMVEFSVPEKILSKVKIGKSVLVLGNLGEISSVQMAIDPKTHMGLARASLKECSSCVIGAHVDVEVAIDERLQALGVPSEAIFLKDGKRHVYVVSDNKAALVGVEVGLSAGSIVEITKGLKSGDVVVMRGQNKLRDGISVQVHK